MGQSDFAELSKLEKNGESVLVEGLKSSTMKVGKLYPVLEEFHGNVIDGKHRLEADGNWPRMRLENVKTEKERIVARLISNACRRRSPCKRRLREPPRR